MPRLRDGSAVDDIRLDRLYEEDWNSLNFPVTRRLRSAEILKLPRSYTWSCGLWLDQGSEGACVGFGCCHELAARPVTVSGLTNDYARTKVYWEAQKIDPWSGGAYPGATPFYEGTSVLAGIKILHKLGFYSEYHWALDLQQLVIGLGYTGPAVLGLDWYEGMYDTDENGFIKVEGMNVGGHCILAIGVKCVWPDGVAKNFVNLDLDRSYITLHNSWGKSWGVEGRAKITLRDMGVLLAANGEACFPKRTSKKAA